MSFLHKPNRPTTLPLAALERIDGICTRFEREWQGGSPPGLGDYLAGAGPERIALFRELLMIDVEYRLRRGEQPGSEDYRRWVPDEAGDAVFESLLYQPGRVRNDDTPEVRVGGEAADRSSVLPGHLARYRIIKIIGRGAFGTVYLAEDRELRRSVALKMAHEPRHVRGDVDAFLTEARVLASLDHPGIIPVYDVGRADDGRPYIVTKLIEGCNLSERLRQGLPTRRQAAQWMATTARALQAAHETGLIHRDIKPSNILTTQAGGIYLGDFGLALSQEQFGEGPKLLGTPAYMSPEQARGEGHWVDARSDVFSLGAVIYELLAGRPPFQAESVTKILKQVLEHDPVAPMRLNPSVGRDLDTICLKCLEKSADRRYGTAGALADDLERYLENRPILARPASLAEKMVRWCRRNPSAATATASALITFLAAFVLVTWSYVRAEQAFREEASQRREVQRRVKAERWERYRSEMGSSSNALEANNAEAAREALAEAPSEYRNWEWGYLAGRLDNADVILPGVPGNSHALLDAEAGRGVFAGETSASIDLRNLGKLQSLRIGFNTWNSELGPKGRFLAVQRDDRTLTLWDVAADRQRGTWQAPVEGFSSFSFNAEESRLAVCCRDWTVRVLDTADGSERLVLRGHAEKPTQAVFSPDGRRLATAGGKDRTARIWNAIDGGLLAILKGHQDSVESVLFSPQGDRLATCEAYPSNRLRLWDATDGSLLDVLQGHDNQILCWTFSPDGDRLATGSYDQTVCLWDTWTASSPSRGLRSLEGGSRSDLHEPRTSATGSKPLCTMTGHRGWVVSVAFSPDGRRLVSVGEDRTLRIWEGTTGKMLAVIPGQTSNKAVIRYTPDSATLVTGAEGGIRLWDAQQVERDGVLKGHTSFVYDVAFHPDGRRVASASWDGTIRLWDASSGATLATMHYPEPTIVSSVAFHPGGRYLASFGRDGSVRFWEVETGRQVGRLPVRSGIRTDTRLRFSPLGDLLACGSRDSAVHLWKITLPPIDVAGGPRAEELPALQGQQGWANDVVFSPDDAWIASAENYESRPIRVWEPGRPESVRVLKGHTDSVLSLAVSPDGRWLASGSADGTIRLWDTTTWTTVAVLTEGSKVYGLAFSPDGTRLASGCGNNTIRLWDTARRQLVCVLHGHDAYVHQVAFSPDGTRLASASGDFTVRIWDSLSPRERKARELAETR